jgi:hypothetical protein
MKKNCNKSFYNVLWRMRLKLKEPSLYSILLVVFWATAAYAGLRVERSSNNLTNGLVGYWPFDGADIVGTIAYDRSGQGNNGTMTGGPLQIIGQVGQGMKFDGNNDYVSVNDPGASSLDITGEVTLSAWIKQKSQGSFGDIVIKGDDGTTTANYGIETVNDQLLFFFSNPTGTYHGLRTTNADFKTNTWYHVAAVYNDAANNIDLYVNGVLKSETIYVGSPENNSIQTNNRKLYIGWDSVNSGEQFDGTIDDVRVYNRALKADEIKRLYNMGAGARTAAPQQAQLTNGLIAYWPFNGTDFNNAGTTTYDRSGTGNNGTMGGTPLKVIGKLGQGLGFDGSNNYVNISTITDDIASGPFSTAFWFKPAATFNNASPASQNMFSLSSLPSLNDFHVRLDNQFGQLVFEMWDPSTALASTSTSWIGGRWYFVAVTYTDTGSKTMTIYIDGQSENSRAGPTRGSNLSPTAFIGQLYDGTLKFNGTIDDVRVYNRCLGADEVKRLYNMGAGMRTAASLQNQLASGLVGYWPFNGQDFNAAGTATYDRSGQGNNGTIVSSPLKVVGKLGQGLSFNGSSDYVTAEYATYGFTELDNFTISAWIYPRSVSGYRNIAGGSYGDYRFIQVDDAAIFYLDSNNLSINSGSVLAVNNWYHVVAVYSNSKTAYVYVNGALKNSGNEATLDWDSGAKFRIGRPFDNTYYFDGIIDDVRVYNRALSADEVKRLYNMGR